MTVITEVIASKKLYPQFRHLSLFSAKLESCLQEMGHLLDEFKKSCFYCLWVSGETHSGASQFSEAKNYILSNI